MTSEALVVVTTSQLLLPESSYNYCLTTFKKSSYNYLLTTWKVVITSSY